MWIFNLELKLDSDVIIEDLIPLVIKMAGDPIANVRFNAAKTMGSLIKVVFLFLFIYY
jgi:hypothetical protein